MRTNTARSEERKARREAGKNDRYPESRFHEDDGRHRLNSLVVLAVFSFVLLLVFH